MNEKLKIPKKIIVGFQARTDTYSGKLAFIVYSKDTGELSQPKSWEGWRDKKIDSENYDNEPLSGFVLNRDVGGTQRSYGWDARREKVRVYDPRNFEIEITVDNLLFILQECSSIKGKGLEGEFVYAWNKNSIVLLPVSCEEYQKSLEYTELQKKTIEKSDMEAGCTYKTRDNFNVMYLGRHSLYEMRCERSGEKIMKANKMHIFLNLDYKGKNKRYASEEYEYIDGKFIYKYTSEKGFTKIAEKTSDRPVDSFPKEYDAFIATGRTSPPKGLIFEHTPVSEIKADYWRVNMCSKIDGNYYLGKFSKSDMQFSFQCVPVVGNGKYKEERPSSPYDRAVKSVSEEQIGNLYIEFENGSKYRLN